MILRTVFRWLLGLFFIAAGFAHFLHPAPYLTMMPPFLPSPELLIKISGLAEILGGFGVLIPFSRRVAAYGLLLLLIAVFPANLNVALHGWPGVSIAHWILWVRLPFQILFMAWVYWVGLYRKPVSFSSLH